MDLEDLRKTPKATNQSMKIVGFAIIASFAGYLIAYISGDLKTSITMVFGASMVGLMNLNLKQRNINKLLLQEVDELREKLNRFAEIKE